MTAVLTPSPQGVPGARVLPHTESPPASHEQRPGLSPGAGHPMVSTGQPGLGTTTGRMWHQETATERALTLGDSPSAQRASTALPPSTVSPLPGWGGTEQQSCLTAWEKHPSACFLDPLWAERGKKMKKNNGQGLGRKKTGKRSVTREEDN